MAYKSLISTILNYIFFTFQILNTFLLSLAQYNNINIIPIGTNIVVMLLHFSLK